MSVRVARVFLAEETSLGRRVKELLLQKGQLEISSAIVLLRDVARALAYAHERGLVHRDIKPGNVLQSTFHL